MTRMWVEECFRGLVELYRDGNSGRGGCEGAGHRRNFLGQIEGLNCDCGIYTAGRRD